MGKYIRKAKTTWEVAVMEVTQSSLGVRTRAKTLALQRLQKSTTATDSSASYLQLRNRRLEKPPIHDSKRQRSHRQNATTTRASSQDGDVADKAAVVDVAEEVQEVQEEEEEEEVNNNLDSGIQASFGENVLDLEGRERGTRESTPCSLIKDPDTVRTPGSTTRPTSSPEMNRRIQNSARRHIPTAHEMDEFFAAAEEQEQREFIEKYNFDPVNDKPLPGRYEWVKLDP